jgi:hypothetical protein
MADNIKTICVRLNLNKPLHKKAYDYLKKMDKSEFPSNSSAIATAVAEYFENKEYDRKLVEQIIESLEKCMKNWFLTHFSSLPPEDTIKQEDEPLSTEIDFDFLGS